MSGSKLHTRILEIADKAHLVSVAVAFHDLETSLRFSFQGDLWFHAASTFKTALLFALFKAAEQDRLRLDDPLHVRNRFLSIIDQSPYRIDRERDGDSLVHRHVGRSMSFHRLAHAMITRSSNLATNLLLDFLGLDQIRGALAEGGITGIEVRRGVEDNLAYDQGISNETTADGLLRLYRVFLDPDVLTEEHRRQALEILFAQEFNSMIPAKLPADAKVAHKTGEISTHCHDAGIVFCPDRKPYILAVLTESGKDASKRQRAVAEIAGAVHRYLTGGHREEK